jgi:hypothetical protein
MARKLLTLLAVVVLGAHLGAGTADAAKKKCPKLCKDIRTQCLAAANLYYPCKTVERTEKKDCRRGLKAAKHLCKQDFKATLQKCKAASDVTDACSPSGAFIFE